MHKIATLLLFAAAAAATADDGGPGTPPSIVIVFDLSYSMTTVDPGAAASRAGLAADVLRELIAGAGAVSAEWALVTVDDYATASVEVGFGSATGDLLAALDGLQPWGVTSLEAMIVAGIGTLAERRTDSAKLLLLVSDCINTYGNMYAFPDLGGLTAAGIVPVVIGFPVREYAGLSDSAAEWIQGAGGVFVHYNQLDTLRRLIAEGGRETTAETGIPANTLTSVAGAIDADSTPVMFPIWWLFLLPIAGLGVYLWKPFAEWLLEKKAVRDAPPRFTNEIGLTVMTRGEDRHEHTFSAFPVNVAATGSADLVLARAKTGSGARSFSLVEDKEGVMFRSRGMLVVNGVGRKSVRINAGDRIAFGRYRIEYRGVNRQAVPPPQVQTPRLLLLATFLPACAVLAVVFRNPVKIGQRVATLPVTMEQRLHEAPEIPERSRQTQMLVVAPVEGAQREITGFPTVMWAPDVTPDFFKLDALFFHAHPDDESLDFGVLASRLTDAGKKVGVVLMTDGGSGLDQYPERPVGGQYPGYDLKGEALAEVRYQEAVNALSVLGVHHYIRFGFRNHAYNGGLDVLTAAAVVDDWGGEDALVPRLSALISGYNPDLVISPEGASEAFEHFEHEAVGALVAKAINALDEGDRPDGVLVSVDPLQKALFPDAVGIDGNLAHRQSGLSYRAVQAAALGKHISQRDASVIGVENLSGFDREYYRLLRWNLERPIEAYLEEE